MKTNGIVYGSKRSIMQLADRVNKDLASEGWGDPVI